MRKRQNIEREAIRMCRTPPFLVEEAPTHFHQNQNLMSQCALMQSLRSSFHENLSGLTACQERHVQQETQCEDASNQESRSQQSHEH